MKGRAVKTAGNTILDRRALAGLALLGVVCLCAPALAQTASFQPINTAATNILTFMTGAFATTVATVAIAAAGYLALVGRIPWSWCFSIVLGCAFIFGGAQIISSLHS